jgi:hypothetical protein
MLLSMRAVSYSILAAFSLSCFGCAAKLQDTALGKVVVYRNGVAYYERKATVENGEITLLVSKDMVDDLLKSLTVTDLTTGKSLPVSFPSREATGRLVKMKIRVPTAAASGVKLSYISESPAWKPTYRLRIVDDAVHLEGWAIVDNVSGEDWKKVVVGVGSTSALSFRYDLWSVRDVQREVLGQESMVSKAPPTATGVALPKADKSGGGREVVLGEDYTRNIPVPGRTFESVLGTAPGDAREAYGVSFSGSTSLENQHIVDGVNLSSNAAGKRSATEIAEEERLRLEQTRRRNFARAATEKRQRRNEKLAKEIRGATGVYVIEGTASPALVGGESAVGSMANHLRNVLIDKGVAPSRLVVRTRVGAVGEPTTLKVLPEEGQMGERASSQDAVGESTFVSPIPVSLANRASTLVPIVDAKTEGEIVYLYDRISSRGSDEFAFKAVRFSNPTDGFLEGGAITVFGDDSFIGEGMTSTIAPGSRTIMPFAMDRQVRVAVEDSPEDRITAINGILSDGVVVEMQRRNTVRYSLTNRSSAAVTVYVRHDTDRGWHLLESPKGLERCGKISVFPVALAAGETKKVSLVESTPISATLDLTSEDGVAALARYLKNNRENKHLVEAGERIVEASLTLRKRLQEIDHLAGQLLVMRKRLDDLHAQTLMLEAVKSRRKSVAALDKRTAEMSERVHETVVQIVDLREEIMVERFAFQELIAAIPMAK